MNLHNDKQTPATTPLQGAFFLGSILFLYLWQLGHRGLWQSEDRWAEIARNMLMTGDYFHPILNGTVYFDKPLASYWLISLVASALGTLDEWAVRLPGVLMAMIATGATWMLARRLFSPSVALLSAWIFATSLGIVFWTRSASADVANVAMATMAVAWFIAYREARSFVGYAGFYLLCVIGAHMKGLTAIVVPALGVLPLVLRDGEWKRHLNLAHVLAVIPGAALYFLPFFISQHVALPEGYQYPERALSGLELVVKENIERFVKPFDHTGSVLTYVTGLPYVLLPWAPAFILALAAYLRRYRALDWQQKWLLEFILILFCFFSLSGSRRWYYILPLVPFCSIVTAQWLLSTGMERVRRLAVWMCGALWVPVVVMFLVSPWLWPLAAQRGFEVSDELRHATLAAGIAALIVGVIAWRRSHWLTRIIMPQPALSALVAMTLLVWVAWFDFQNEAIDDYRTERAFAQSLKSLNVDPAEVVFFTKAPPKIVFYVNSRVPFREVSDASALVTLLRERSLLVVAERRDADTLPALLGLERLPAPLLAEQDFKWEKRSELGKKLAVWRLGGSQ